MKISRINSSGYIWGNNCEGYILSDSPELNVKEEVMPPHTKEKLHRHDRAQQFFYILKGKAVFHIDGIEEILNANEGITIKSGQKHFIENKSEHNLEFLVISQPNTQGDRIDLE